jgi:hypothetical protein
MPPRARHLPLVRDAIKVVQRRLAAPPPSPEVEELRARAEVYRLEAEAWKVSSPTAEERERLMKRVLSLHVEVAKLDRRP